MENEKQPKRSIWRQIGEGCVEVIGELLVMLILFAIGAGRLMLIRNKESVEAMDPEWIVLIGAVAVLAFFGIFRAAITVIRKHRKKCP